MGVVSGPQDGQALSLLAALERAALADLTSWPRLLATGRGFLPLLHRLSTGDVAGLCPGEGRPTVITSPKGRIVARLIVVHLGVDGILILSGPGTGERVIAHLEKYALGEETGLVDISPATTALAIVGPQAAEAAGAAGLPELPAFAAAEVPFAGRPARVVRTNGFDGDGVLVIVDNDDATLAIAALEATVVRVGGARLVEPALEAWRVLTGRPISGRELTEEHNPLEAGLRDAVSFTKGCYVGQEVVARLNTYDKVSRTIVRLSIDAGTVPPAGARVVSEGQDVGTVTSAILPPGRSEIAALAYVKRREILPGTENVEIVWDAGRSRARLVNP